MVVRSIIARLGFIFALEVFQNTFKLQRKLGYVPSLSAIDVLSTSSPSSSSFSSTGARHRFSGGWPGFYGCGGGGDGGFGFACSWIDFLWYGWML